MAFNTTINQLSGTSTFYDWFIKENNEIISKLNQITVSGVTSGDGVLATTDATSGLVTVSIGGTSGNILGGLTFSGAVSFLGETVVPNTSFKTTGITVGTSGYTFGSVVRITSAGYTLAKANSADGAEVIGVLSSLNNKYSVVTVSGRIDGNFTTVAGGTLSPGCVYFLSPSSSGSITTTEPSTIGYVSKPVIIGLGQTAGMIVQYRGNYLNSTTIGNGNSGSNKIYITLPASRNPGTYGFSAGNFLSYAQDQIDGNTFFHQYLKDTGRTSINGWFLSGCGDYTYTTPQANSYYGVNNEEEFIIGMVESITTSGSDLIYQLITHGSTVILPYSISSYSSSKVGSWLISGVTYNVSAAGITQMQKVNYNEYNPNTRLGFVFDTSPSYWYVDIKNVNLNNAGPASLQNLVSNLVMTNTQNFAFNGDFSVWQRDTGKTSYTTAGNVYFADNWIRRQTGITSGVQSLVRQDFSSTSTEVEGNPSYYVDIKCVANPAGTDPNSNTYSIGHVIENINTFNGSNLTVGFYAKCALSGYSAKVYFARYSGGSQVSKSTIATVDLSTTWTKHTLTYEVPDLTASPPFSDDYIEIGIDMIPAVKRAYDLGLPTGTNLTVSVASFVVYNGVYSTPSHNFERYEDKFKKAQKFYYTTYSSSQTSATKTMLPTDEPALNTYTFTYLPNSPFSVLKFPTIMREEPSVTVYSPFTGIASEMYNYTASKDLRNASTTTGYNNAMRYSQLGSSTVSTVQDTSSVRINIGSGAVPYDVINCHVVADASYPI